MNEPFTDYSILVWFNNDKNYECRVKYYMKDGIYRYPKLNEIIPGVGRVTAMCYKNLIYIKNEN